MTKFKPTDSELEILHILWEKGASSVRDINDLLNLRREVGYTTTLKLMQIMNEKGLVKEIQLPKLIFTKLWSEKKKPKTILSVNLSMWHFKDHP